MFIFAKVYFLLTASYACSTVLSLPMRNWNPPFRASLCIKNPAVLSLPMRNWNFFGLKPILNLPKFWVYLWGIETRRAYINSEKGRRFESTYEELKLSFAKRLKKEGESFESTYEELKLEENPCKNINVTEFWVYLWGIETNPLSFARAKGISFESTYEELKHNSHYFGGIEYLQFWVYLWGIETWLTRTIFPSDSSFWVYLWGIETRSNAHFPFFHNEFWVYLWGIETNHFVKKKVLQPMFWVYLWGIETADMTMPAHAGSPVLSLPMRNWNSSVAPWYFFVNAVLSLPMRNWNYFHKSRIWWILGKFWVYLWGIETTP